MMEERFFTGTIREYTDLLEYASEHILSSKAKKDDSTTGDYLVGSIPAEWQRCYSKDVTTRTL